MADLPDLAALIQHELELAASGEGYEPPAVAEAIVTEKITPLLAAKDEALDRMRVEFDEELTLSRSLLRLRSRQYGRASASIGVLRGALARDKEVFRRLGKELDELVAERKLLLWLHAEAVWKLERLRAETDPVRIGNLVYAITGRWAGGEPVDAQVDDAVRVLRADETDIEELRAERDELWAENEQLRAELDALKAKDIAATEQQWCVWYGGPDPDNAAGVEVHDYEASAREAFHWYRSDLGSGVAVRDVRLSPWRVVPVAETESAEQVPECGEYGSNDGICGEAVPDGFCSEHGEVGPQPSFGGGEQPCPHGILLGMMMVCPACEPEKQAEAEDAARRHAARTQVGWKDPRRFGRTDDEPAVGTKLRSVIYPRHVFARGKDGWSCAECSGNAHTVGPLGWGTLQHHYGPMDLATEHIAESSDSLSSGQPEDSERAP